MDLTGIGLRWIAWFLVCCIFTECRSSRNNHRRREYEYNLGSAPDYLDFQKQYAYRQGSLENAGERQLPLSSVMTCNCSWGAETQTPSMIRFKIVGGRTIPKRSIYPMIAGLVYHESGCIICGASILTEYHVLTAAHCVSDHKVQLSVAVGVQQRCFNSNEGLIELSDLTFVHEGYSEELNHNDIAIVLTRTRIPFSDRVGPTCLHNQPFHSTDHVWVLGWGKQSEQGNAPARLKIVDLTVVNLRACEMILPKTWISRNKSLQMCTYGFRKDACSGDSGGPLFWYDPRINRLSQVAIVSMGLGCARRNIPAVNTAVYPYFDWIQNTVLTSWKYILNSQDYSVKNREVCQVIYN